MTYFIGIDAGGTKTNAVLADETKVLARVSAGTVKLSRVGAEQATETLHALLQDLSTSANVKLTEIAVTCMGMAGAAIPDRVAWAEAALAEKLGGQRIIVGDEIIALEAAFRGGPGVLVIAGTGSHVVARGPDGRLARAGGYGGAVSDEGSGHWIGHQAVRRALYHHDAQTVRPLLAMVMREWNSEQFSDVIAKANAAPDFSKLVRAVCAVAAEGDADALAILHDAGRELALLVRLVLARLGESALPIACTGSILEYVPAVRHAMAAALPGIDVREGVVDPLLGALWLARQEN